MRSHVVAISALALSGCLAPLDTGGLKTSDLRASFNVSYSSGSVTCSAYFYSEANGYSYVVLDDDDFVTCDGKIMTSTGSGGYSVNVPYVAGKEYQMALIRKAESTYVAHVSVPSLPTGTTPVVGATVVSAQELTVTWVASTDPRDETVVQVTNGLSGSSAIFANRAQKPETGHVLFTSTEMRAPVPTGGTRSGSISFYRTRYGAMPTGLAGEISSFRGSGYTIFIQD